MFTISNTTFPEHLVTLMFLGNTIRAENAISARSDKITSICKEIYTAYWNWLQQQYTANSEKLYENGIPES